MKCPNCGNELHIDETQQTITCECGKVYKNPMYKPPVEEKKMVLKEKKTAKSKLPYILIIATMVLVIASLVIASLVVGSICLATVKPVTGVAMAKKLQKAGYDVELYRYTDLTSEGLNFPSDVNGRIIATVSASKKDKKGELIDGMIIYFSTIEAAKDCYGDLKDDDVEIKGKKVFWGDREFLRDAMD